MEDDVATQEDIDFLDDTSFPTDGMEQAGFENDRQNDENQNPTQMYDNVMRSVKGRKRKIQNDEDDKEKKQKKRSEKRKLQTISERGIGEGRRSVQEYHKKAPFHLKVADLVTPWENQPGRKRYDFGADIGKLEQGAFGDEVHRRWVNDAKEQSLFAKLFYVPMTGNVPLRKVSTDVPNTNVGVEFPRSNATTKVLHAFRTMHPKTELDYMEDKFYEKVLLGCQRTTQELRQNLDGGPFGGLQGKAVDVLWKVYAGDEVSNLDPSTLQLVQVIGMALQGNKGDELWPMVSTQYTEPYVRGKQGLNKVQSGVQTLREYNFYNASQHSFRCAVDDLDKRIVKRVWKYRFGEDEEVPWGDKESLSEIVDMRFRKSMPEKSGMEVNIEAQSPSTDPVIVDLWVYKDIFHAWDEKNKMQTNVTVEAIYICAKAPACDPLVILRSIAENNPTANTLLSGYLGNMRNTLGFESCPWDQLFNTDRAGATEVVSEAAMLQGIFKFCEAQDLRNINVGGFRMDVRNKAEMSAWNRYMKTVTNARRKHYEITTREVLHDRSNLKDAHLPVEDWKLDFVHGAIYWKTAVRDVLTEMDEYEQMFDEEDREYVRTELREWFRGHFFEDDPSSGEPAYMFLCEGVGFASNTGIWIKIRTDNKMSFEEEKLIDRIKRSKVEEVCILPQPQQQNPMIRLWCANMSETHDPLDEVFCHSMLVPDLKWMTEEMPKLDRAVESMLLLKEAVGDVMIFKHTKIQSGVNPRLREIMSLTGKERNPLKDKITSMDYGTHIKYLYKLKMNKIRTVIKQTVQIMSSCELAMWRTAAMGIRDLKRQSSSAAEKWSEDYKHFSNACASAQMTSWKDFLCFSTKTSLFYTHSLNRIDSDLSYMNTLLQIIMRNSFMAFGMNTPGAYGMTLRIGDMGISTKILTESEGKNKSTNVMVFDTKFPGMGIDQCTGNLLQQCNAAMIHISLTKDHKDMAVLAVDTSMKTVSKFSYSTLQGSAVLVDSRGEILPLNNDFQKKCGNLCFFSEWGKDSMDISTMGCIESNLANSGDQEHGAESGVQQNSWQTTQFLESCADVKIRKLPILYITGNKPSTATPASAIEGGRWVHIASSTQDNENGFYMITKETVHSTFKPSVPRVFQQGQLECVDMDEDAEGLSAQALMANSVSTKDVRKDIKIIKREVVLRNRIHFLLMQWMKRDAVLLLSALTSDPKSFSYTMRCNFSNVEAAVGVLTLGLRREYLQKMDGKFWHRNAIGPWSKVSLVSTHVYLTMTSALLSAMDNVAHGWPLDMLGAFELGIRAVMTQSISFSAMLNSLHIWLSSAVLDINIMIMSSFIYHFTGFQHTCSLRVLSLAIIGELNDTATEDWQAYVKFCEFMAPCLLEEHVLKPDSLRAGRMRKGPRNVCRGVLKTPSHSVLAQWTDTCSQQSNLHSVHEDSNAFRSMMSIQQDVNMAYQARTQGPEQEPRSVYCKPRLSFVHTEGIKGFSCRRDQVYATCDDNISGTASRALATMIAREQKPSAHQLRVDKDVFMFEHENTGDFWKNVQMGTAMPQSNSSTNDVYKLKFEEPQYTGIWWEETVKNAGLCDGVLKSFLLQSKLDPFTTTEHQFWTKLLTPYLRHISSTSRVYGGPMSPGIHKNAWSSLVLDKNNMFQFESNPFKTDHDEYKGVSVNLCMRLVHYMIMQGLGVTRDWDPNARDDVDFVSCVHLRNVSHMSLGLLGLFLHTCCDKSLIPANDGKLRLSAPCPVSMSKKEAQIEYDPRLHIDSLQHRMCGKSDNVLSVASRIVTNANWELLEFSNRQCALWYRSVIRDYVQMSQAQSRANLFPFPPESVAHTSFIFEDMYLANFRYSEFLERQWSNPDMDCEEKMFHDQENVFAVAMLNMGNSMNFELCAHMQPSLTDCVIRDKREIPCVTFEHGFLFTIAFSDGLLYIRPTYKTHQWTAADTLNLREELPFRPLPLAHEGHEVVVPSSHFFMIFQHGLTYEKISNELLSVEVTVKHTDRKKLPFYMFPVVHFPILLRLEHSGWNVKGNVSLLLHTDQYFYWKHETQNKFRNFEDKWLGQNCAEVFQLLADCNSARPSVHVDAYFADDKSTQVLGFWATEDGVRVHFGSADQLRRQLAKDVFCDVSEFLPSPPLPHGEDAKCQERISPYLMLECRKYGLVPLCRSADGEDLVARFTDSEAQNSEKIVQFTKNFQNTTPRMLPLGEDSTRMCMGARPPQEIWGLVVENNNGSFLTDGCYTVSSTARLPCGKEHMHFAFEMDFINMSRCMLVEGSELWVSVTRPVYHMIVQQIKKQGLDIMLPVSKLMHENMQGTRLVRAFYVLGGSAHDQNIQTNTIRLTCFIANKKSTLGNGALADDNPDLDSIVNQSISMHDTRMVAISLPIIDQDGLVVVSCHRDPSMPVYLYFKERSPTRA